jgi:hypothetical protein
MLCKWDMWKERMGRRSKIGNRLQIYLESLIMVEEVK